MRGATPWTGREKQLTGAKRGAKRTASEPEARERRRSVPAMRRREMCAVERKRAMLRRVYSNAIADWESLGVYRAGEEESTYEGES